MTDSGTLFQVERAAYRLAQIEVYNWGPFSGLHRAEIDAEGTAVIGKTGSGKTTLIDAYITLLTERPQYNLASTGGHGNGDRNLLSYVRGVIGSGNDSGDASHISRKGKTVTGICATYSNGTDTLRLGCILWIDGNGFSATDLKKAWLFSHDVQQGLEHWLTLHNEGGLRRLKQQVNNSNSDTTHIYDASTGGKARYLSRVRDFFEVSDNAFALLNRAAGLKQLNSIDEIFRELVLDDRSQFDRASEVVGDFDRLTEIHEELLTAQRQERSLLPVQSGHKAFTVCLRELEKYESLKQLLPTWVAENGYRLWNQRSEELATELNQKSAALQKAEAKTEELQKQKDTYYETYLQAGGQNLEDLQARIKEKQGACDKCESAQKEYQQLCANLNLEAPIDADGFAQMQTEAQRLKTNGDEQKEAAQEEVNQLGAHFTSERDAHSTLTEQLKESHLHKDTNIRSEYLSLRATLAKAIDLDAAELPYVAELIEVKSEESDWRGAIERALGGNRLRLLVPAAKLKSALHWINAQNQFRLHIRCWSADSHWEQTARFMPDGFTQKLRFKEHPLREALKHFLANHDLHCIASPDELATTEHALTREGLTSGKQRYFEKKDQRPLNEDWITGFDNRDRVAMLEGQVEEADQRLNDARKAYETAKRARSELDARNLLLDQLARLDFERIDFAGRQGELNALEKRFSQLSSPDSDAGKAFQAYQKSIEDLRLARADRDRVFQKKISVENELRNANSRRDEMSERRAEGLTIKETELAREALPWPEALRPQQLDTYEREQAKKIEGQLTQLNQQRSTLTTNLVRAMEHAKQQDTGALAEAGTELIDIPSYLERLRVLEEEALPAKSESFKKYLN